MAVRSGVNPSGFVGASGKPERVQQFHDDTTGLRVEVPVGSPASRSFGKLATARATATHCRLSAGGTTTQRLGDSH